MKNMLIGLAALLAFVTHASAADAVADCAGVTDIKSKSRTSDKLQTMMINLLTLEKQGEANFTPAYAAPISECVFERFAVGETAVTAVYTPWEKKAEQTLIFRFLGAGTEGREIVVVYDPLASIIAEKTIFFVIEKRNGIVSYYEMYRDQPSYAALKPLAASIFDGSAKSIAKARWPAGAKEPVLDAPDSMRMK
jgi:hypothetical protein